MAITIMKGSTGERNRRKEKKEKKKKRRCFTDSLLPRAKESGWIIFLKLGFLHHKRGDFDLEADSAEIASGFLF